MERWFHILRAHSHLKSRQSSSFDRLVEGHRRHLASRATSHPRTPASEGTLRAPGEMPQHLQE